jgi:hypothetical protein
VNVLPELLNAAMFISGGIGLQECIAEFG